VPWPQPVPTPPSWGGMIVGATMPLAQVNLVAT
jgi:hypothetical protein